MSYNKAIPAADDRLKDSQAQILENFATNSALLGVDHVISPWTDPATGNQGKHNKVTMPEQAVAPTIAANEMGLYTKEENSVSQLFVRRESDGTEINLTNNATQTDAGTITLPCGLIMKWGLTTGGTLAGNAWKEITFPVAFPTACFNIQVSGKVITAQPSDAQTTTLIILNNTWTKTSFYVWNRTTGVGSIASDCTWFAIGN